MGYGLRMSEEDLKILIELVNKLSHQRRYQQALKRVIEVACKGRSDVII